MIRGFGSKHAKTYGSVFCAMKTPVLQLLRY